MRKILTLRWIGLGLAVYLLAVLSLLPFWTGSQTIDPVLFSIGAVEVRWYGLIIGLSVLVGYFLVEAINRRWKLMTSNQLVNLTLIAFLSGIIGARLMFVWLKWPLFQDNPGLILDLTSGGLSIHGALIFGALGVIGYLYWIKRDVVEVLDLLVPGVALGQAIGRFGNFFNQEAFGPPADVFWGMFIEEQFRPEEYAGEQFFHPTFLYESILMFILFLILVNLPKQKAARLTGYIMGYGVIRFVIEFWRLQSDSLGGFTLAQWASILMVAFASWIYIQEFNQGEAT